MRMSDNCLERDGCIPARDGGTQTKVKFGKVDGGPLSETMFWKMECGDNFFLKCSRGDCKRCQGGRQTDKRQGRQGGSLYQGGAGDGGSDLFLGLGKMIFRRFDAKMIFRRFMPKK